MKLPNNSKVEILSKIFATYTKKIFSKNGPNTVSFVVVDKYDRLIQSYPPDKKEFGLCDSPYYIRMPYSLD